ncbi:MAG: flavin monoamine oxidase family protein [Thiobacillus sp.]
MLDTLIIGGGLCGLALARSLHAQGRSFVLYEARDRLGGRILSVPSETAGMALDLGPTWFWPDTQPRIVKLLTELGLRSFAQHDDGSLLRLTAHDQKPERMEMDSLHGGARRVEGGMAALVEALADGLPADAIRLQQELIAVRDRGTHVELLFRRGEITTIVHARHAVLAVPPRLLEERVHFAPALDDPLRDAMRATPTWMADQAKAVVGFAAPFWRAAGESGNAFVSHEQVVLGEIFDACDAGGRRAALGGFFALPPQFRASVHPVAMPMLISSQLVQVFGSEAEHGEQHVQDWAAEPFTCSTLDLTPPDSHPEYGNPHLRRPLWNGKLFLGGSETAGTGGGYLEGALEAAARILRELAATAPASEQPLHGNAACLARFNETVAALRSGATQRYRQHLHRYLSAQASAQLTQRALLDTVEQVYSEALDQLGGLAFDAAGVAVQRGRCELTPAVLAPFEDFNAALLDEVVQLNRTSCALSNFPDEHDPGKDYRDAITRDLAAAWREFAINANAVLLNRGQDSGFRDKGAERSDLAAH